MSSEQGRKLTLNQVQDLEKHPVWQEMIEVLKLRVEIIRNELEVGKVHSMEGTPLQHIEDMSIEEIRKRQEACREIRYFLALPRILLDEHTTGQGE